MRRQILWSTVAALSLLSPQVMAQESQPEVAQDCLQELQQVNADLVERGYGTIGPGRPPTAAPGAGTTATRFGPVAASPRAEMRTALRAGYMFAMNGDQQTCEAILAGVQRMREQVAQQAAAGDTPQADMREWREEYLAAAIPVEELENPIQVDDLMGADVRNAQDQDLGDVGDVLLDRGGGIQYVFIERGGFLGIGEERVPVPWQDMSIVADPYDNTLVLDVSEQVFDNAPTLRAGENQQLAAGDWRQEVDQYWEENTEG